MMDGEAEERKESLEEQDAMKGDVEAPEEESHEANSRGETELAVAPVSEVMGDDMEEPSKVDDRQDASNSNSDIAKEEQKAMDEAAVVDPYLETGPPSDTDGNREEQNEQEQPRILLEPMRRSPSASSSMGESQDRSRRFLQTLKKLGGVFSAGTAQADVSAENRDGDCSMPQEGVQEDRGQDSAEDSVARKRKRDEGDQNEDDRSSQELCCPGETLSSSSCRTCAGELPRGPKDEIQDKCETHEILDACSKAIEEKTSRDCEEDACENSLQKRQRLDEEAALEAGSEAVNTQVAPIFADLDMVPSPARATS
jgi:hypothetical protein